MWAGATTGSALTVTARAGRVVAVGQAREVRRRGRTGVAGGSAWLYRVLVPTRPVDPGALRRGTLAASVLDDIPLTPSADGVIVGRSWDDRDAWTPVTLGPARGRGRRRPAGVARGSAAAARLAARLHLPVAPRGRRPAPRRRHPAVPRGRPRAAGGPRAAPRCGLGRGVGARWRAGRRPRTAPVARAARRSPGGRPRRRRLRRRAAGRPAARRGRPRGRDRHHALVAACRPSARRHGGARW